VPSLVALVALVVPLDVAGGGAEDVFVVAVKPVDLVGLRLVSQILCNLRVPRLHVTVWGEESQNGLLKCQNFSEVKKSKVKK
jgi:hypothetical protein